MSQSEADTRTRLLESAALVFAERGFKAATVRSIVSRAGANLGAVNYHFRDKETLYAEVLCHLCRTSLERYPIEGGLGPDQPVRARLRAFVRNFLNRVLGIGQPEWTGRLMAREMAEPTPIFATVVEQVLAPTRAYLVDLMRELLGNRPGQDIRAELSANSVVAQCVFYRHFERFDPKIRPYRPQGEDFIEVLTEHITSFSLSGLSGPEETVP